MLAVPWGARLVLLIGASGAGKSSVLKAGVLPQLSRRRDQWIVLPVMRPEKSPLEAFAKTLAEMQREPQAWRAWHERLRRASAVDEVAELVKDWRVGEARTATVLLPIDQFEEIFTIAEPSEGAAFLRLIAALLDRARDLPIMAVATGRADVLESLLATSSLGPLTETVSLEPMPLDRVPHLVEGPATVAAIAVEPGLAQRIMRDVETREALPLLAQTLRLLYDHRDTPRLTHAAYESLGGAGANPVRNSVRRAADEAITAAQPSEAELAALRDAFIPHLVRLRLDDNKRTRQPALIASLPRDAERLIRALTDARLLITRTDDGKAVAEVAHEALFDTWPTLSRWIEQEQHFLADIERLKSAQKAWSEATKNDKPQALLHGLLLKNALHALAEHPGRFSGREMEELRSFILSSRRAVLRRRMHLVTVLGAAVLILPVIAGIVWAGLVWWGVRQVEAEMKFVAIPKGCFQMGDSKEDAAKDYQHYNEGPVHQVCLQAFDLGQFEVTQAEWASVMIYPDTSSPSYYKGIGGLPVEQVSWNDVQRFLWRMSFFGSGNYRLPTESEWEYAARAGTTTNYYWGTDFNDACSHENVADMSLRKIAPDLVKQTYATCSDGYAYTAPVGSYNENPFHLYDMLGNVEEWVEDCWVASYANTPTNGSAYTSPSCQDRDVRGGSWRDGAEGARASDRDYFQPVARNYYIGFRVVRSETP